MGKLKIKKGDRIVVLSGSSKGKEGEVLKIIKEKDRAIVEGVNMIKKHTKPNSENPQGGITETEGPIHISNIALIDPSTKSATRVRYEFQDGKKVRVAVKSGKTI